MATFAAADQVLFRSLPYGYPSHLVSIFSTDQRNGTVYFSFPADIGVAVKAQVNDLESVGFAGRVRSYRDEARRESIRLFDVSYNLLDVLEVRPAIGRQFNRSDLTAEALPILIRWETWSEKYGSEHSVIGRRFLTASGPLEIVGVLPRSFVVPSVNWATPSEGIVLSRQTLDTATGRQGLPGLIARAREGAPLDRIQAAVAQVEAASLGERLGATHTRLKVRWLQEGLFWNARFLLVLVSSAAGVIWFLSSLNLGVLLAAQFEASSGAYAIQACLGAPIRRMVLAVMIQVSYIVVAAAAVAWLAYGLAQDAIASILPPYLRQFLLASGSSRMILAITCVGAVGASVACLLPLWRLAKLRLVDSISQSSIVAAPAPIIRAVIAVQVALATALVVSGGLTVRSLLATTERSLGFTDKGLYVLNVSAGPGIRVPEVLEALRVDKDVLVATVDIPLGVGESPQMVRLDRGIEVARRKVSGNYLDVLGGRLLAGRTFQTDSQSDVAIVSASAARAIWPNLPIEDAVGKHVSIVGDVARTIIGISSDTRERHAADVIPEILVPSPNAVASYLVRPARHARMDQTEIAAVLGQRLGSAVAVTSTSVQDAVGRWLQSPRSLAVVFGTFAVTAAAVGLSGLAAVCAWSVGRRRREVALRLALGAGVRHLWGPIVGKELIPPACGIAAGLVMAYLGSRLMESLLFGVSADDPANYIVGGVMLASCSVLVVVAPAWRLISAGATVLLRLH